MITSSDIKNILNLPNDSNLHREFGKWKMSKTRFKKILFEELINEAKKQEKDLNCVIYRLLDGQKARLKMAKEMLRQNIAIESVISTTKLSKEEIDTL